MYKLKKYSIVILFFVLLTGCQSSQVQDTQTTTPNRDVAEMRPDIRNLDELTVAFSSHDLELDFRKSYFSSEAQLFTAIYEGLFTYHPFTLEPVPALAERWELSSDRLQWTFTIRRNARFWNGDPVRAEDFKAAWLSLLDPRKEYPYSSFFDVIEGARDYRNGLERDPNKVGITAVDSRTLVVKLTSPASFFLAMLCHHSFSTIHPSMINKEQWSPRENQRNWTPPVSNGPFRITSMNDESIVLQKCGQYWDRQNVALNKITIKFTSTADEAANLWNSGEARWISGDVNIDALTDRSGIQVNVMFATHYYFIRSSEKPFDDHRVRRAMALVLPWEEIRGNYYLPAESLIFPISGYPEVKGITEENYEEALKLMAEAGYTNLEGMPELIIRLTPSRDASRVGALMANAWKNILGFNVRVEVISFDRYYQSLKDDGYTVASVTWIGDFADPYAFLKMWRNDSNLNDARLYDPDYDTLIDRSMIEDGRARLNTLAEAEKLLLDRGVVLPICYNPAVNIIDTGEIEGWYPNPLDIHPFKYMFFKSLRPLPGVALGN
ncbi:MAG: peptide ABC transporter substrate-binding protein [Treponema sp.]|nr:peptide ABC transporter substrate-binding protein [Treponema sp.]